MGVETMLPKWLTAACAIAMLLVIAPVAALADDDEDDEQEQESAEVDYLGLAARMIHDGHPGRALSVLADVDPKDPKVDAARFYTLRGLARVDKEQFKQARKDFEAAIKSGQKDEAVQIYLAQACFTLEDYKCTLSALERAGKTGSNKPGVFLMHAEAAWNAGQKATSLGVLAKGEKKFRDESEFQRLQIFHLIDMGLYQEAVLVSDRYLARDGMKAADYVAVAEALRAAKAYERAQVLMEGARLRYPEDENVAVQLAHCYLEAGRKFAAAMLFEEAARINDKYTMEAAELYKEAGLLHRARWLNARVSDQKAKSKQRLSLLLEGEEFDAVTAMLPKLSRLGLLSDENIRYAVAYAFYKTGRFAEAERELKPIKDPQLFESALQLRKAIASCREAGWECSP